MFRVLFFLLLSLPVFSAQENSKRLMLKELSAIEALFETSYAPLKFKEERFGWNLRKEIAKAEEVILKTPNLTWATYHTALRGFFGSTRDYHCGVSFYSRASSILPFGVYMAEDRLFVTWSNTILLKAGDEILTWENKPVKEVIQNLAINRWGQNPTATDLSLACSELTMRLGICCDSLDTGAVMLRVAGKGEASKLVQVKWDTKQDEAATAFGTKHDDFVKKAGLGEESPSKLSSLLPKVPALPQLALEARSAAQKISDPFQVHSRTSFVPELGMPLWSGGSYYPTYIYELEGKKVGVVRVASYSYSGESAFREFCETIKKLQLECDALVINQTNNGGGYTVQGLGLTTCLLNKEQQTTRDRLSLAPDFIYGQLSLLDEIAFIKTEEQAKFCFGTSFYGYPVSLDFVQQMRNHAEAVVAEWNAGTSLTKPMQGDWVDVVKPHSTVQFTKPILVLVNELCFSMADFIPALLQDAGRATIVGTRTGGAGGTVDSMSWTSAFGVKNLSLTRSLAYRPNGQVLENLGVTPDVEIPLTARDLQEGFCDYKNAVNTAVSKLFSKI